MITRRSFFLGSAAGLILPTFYDNAISFLANHGEPLLVIPKQHESILYAVADSSYEFNFGDPYAGPPEISIREFYMDYRGVDDVNLCLLEEGCEPEDLPDLENSMSTWSEWEWFDTWARTESPNALAYHFLAGFDLGPSLIGASAIGGISLIDGPMPGNDYLGAQAEDAVSVSLLQQRLNELNSGIRIELI